MGRIINKIGRVLQVILMAPIKLPGKVSNIIKYIALGLEVVDELIKEEKGQEASFKNGNRSDRLSEGERTSMDSGPVHEDEGEQQEKGAEDAHQ